MNITPDEMTALARKVRETIEKAGYHHEAGVGFAVLLVPYNAPDEHARYVSNLERNDVRNIFRIMVQKWDTDEHVKMGGKIR